MSLKPPAWVQQDLCPVFLKFLALAVEELCPVFCPNSALAGQLLCAALQGVWVAWESQFPALVRSDQAKYPGALADLSVAQGALLSAAGPLSELLPVERRTRFGAAGQAAVAIHRETEVALLAAWSGSEPF